MTFVLEECLAYADAQTDSHSKGGTVGLLILCHKNKRFGFPGGHALYFCSRGSFMCQLAT